ncbi:hypothetical protein PL75_03290 [Neisseria arctica]|uniref:Terminase small subunit n=1 Tax=Neisseria arctica TaxID=1470200 RepID=A0A0J1C4M2_9NEIS|nr:terminase small subunit [Neisseria arctica]KLT73263.1 hypothetical protein PL75_03290 [Neisseria arctica]UOO87482.1 DNA-packaging protein [Neisseria arctica]
MAEEAKRPVGRPSGFKQEYLEAAAHYLKGGFIECGDRVPTVAGLACFIGTSNRQVCRWASEHEEFRHALEAIKTAQEKLLINGGLSGDYNATIVKLMLANHGYSDKVENNHTSSDGSMTPVTKIELVPKS